MLFPKRAKKYESDNSHRTQKLRDMWLRVAVKEDLDYHSLVNPSLSTCLFHHSHVHRFVEIVIHEANGSCAAGRQTLGEFH